MINLTIIGLGKWGLELVKSINKNSKIVRFNSVISRNPGRIKKEAKKYKLSIFENYDDLLFSKKIDGFVLCTPHSSHEKQIKNLTKYKKPIFVEKPLALDVKSAKNIITICKKENIILAVGQNRRFLETYLFLKKQIKKNKIGKITHIEGSFSGKSSFKDNKNSWRNKISETPLGGMTGKGIHITDLMINLNGGVNKVLARSKKLLKSSQLDDSTDLILQFKNGTMGYLSTILATNKYWELKVFGSNGWIKIFNEKELIQQIGKSKIENINLKYTNIEKRELEEFAKCIKYNKKFSVDLSEVLENTKLFEASIKSKKLNSKFIKI
jgi:predicted dehydrogenase